MFCHLLFRSAGAMAPRGFAIFVGKMPMFGVVAVFAMRWVVGFGQPVGLLCGLVVGLHSQYEGKNKKKRIQDTI